MFTDGDASVQNETLTDKSSNEYLNWALRLIGTLASSNHNDHKGIRLRLRTFARLCFLKLRRWQVNLVLGRIDIHRPGAGSSRYGLHDVEFAIFLLGYVEVAVPAAREGLMAIPAGCIHSGADGKVGKHLAAIGAHHNHLLRFAASNKKSVLHGIDRQADR